jgi:hypothetical protein
VIVGEPVARDRSGLPVDRSANPRLVDPAEVDQRAQEVAVQAMDDRRALRRPSEATVPRLRVRQDGGAGPLDRPVTRVGPHLVEEHQRPDGAGVLGPVPRPRPNPEPLVVLGLEDRRDRWDAHRGGSRAANRERVGGFIHQGDEREMTYRRIVALEEPGDRIVTERAPPRHHRSYSSLK